VYSSDLITSGASQIGLSTVRPPIVGARERDVPKSATLAMRASPFRASLNREIDIVRKEPVKRIIITHAYQNVGRLKIAMDFWGELAMEELHPCCNISGYQYTLVPGNSISPVIQKAMQITWSDVRKISNMPAEGDLFTAVHKFRANTRRIEAHTLQ